MKKLAGTVLCLVLMLSAGMAMADPMPELSADGHKAFDALINGEATVENCAEGEQACPVKLAALHEKMRAKHAENEACKSEFRYSFHDIDCGGDGVPDLLIDYRGLCLYDYSENEISGTYVMIYRDAQGKYRVGNEVEYWERSSFEISNRSFYGTYGSCGADCFINESGYFDKQCKSKKLLVIDHPNEMSELHLPGVENEGISPVVIDGKTYYHFLSEDIKDAQVLKYRRNYSSIKRYCPKMFQKSFDIASLLLTSDEEGKLLEAAQKAHIPAK
ncbi:MAG: hypothetical protein IJU23_02190 [Proteobacteria bacterium]|nr:hypothetical protein [Pseudomonadota bacterium]